MIRHPTRLQLFEVWFADQGLVWPLLLVTLAFVAAIACVFPLGPAQTVVGVVQEVTIQAAKNSNRRVARVSFGSATFFVDTSADRCAAGDPIRLLRQRRLLGDNYSAATPACPGSREYG